MAFAVLADAQLRSNPLYSTSELSRALINISAGYFMCVGACVREGGGGLWRAPARARERTQGGVGAGTRARVVQRLVLHTHAHTSTRTHTHTRGAPQV